MKKFHDVILDEAGNIVVGAELYVRNNTTPFALVTLYSDNGVTTTANPVVSGNDGYCTFWTADNTLKLEVYVDGELEKTITDYQHYDDLDAEITALRSVTSAADKVFYFTGSGAGAVTDFTSAARSVLDDTTVAAMLTTLGMSTDGTLAANSDTIFASQKAVKTYVDTQGGGSGFTWKTPVRVATTAAGTLASDFENGDTIDGVVLATGDRILIKNQAAASANGIYVVAASGAPTRATDMDASSEFVSAALFVSAGTANHDTQWTCTNDTPPTVGTTDITFVQIASGAGLLQATNNLSELASASTSRTNLGVAYASAAEINTGTEASKVISPDAFAGSTRSRVVATLLVSDPNGSAISTGDGKLYWRVPSTCNGMDLVAVAAAVTTASTSGIPTVQIANVTQAADMLTTKLTIDANETDSSTAAAAAVIDTGNDDVATGDMLRIDVDVAGTGTKGLIVELQFQTP